LESKSADLADCFIQMIKLAVAINRIPLTNPFKADTIKIFNRRYLEFQHPAYQMAYFMHPYYRGNTNFYSICYDKLTNISLYIGSSLKDSGFRDVALTSIRLWQSLGHSEESSKELISQLRRFEGRLAPFDLPYTIGIDTPSIWWGSIRQKPRRLAELACHVFSINPSQASCERNFSTLKWLLGNYRTRTTITRLEGMAKVRSYHTSNIQDGLSYKSELTEAELREVIRNTAIGSIMEMENDNGDEELPDSDSLSDDSSLDIQFSSTILELSNTIDLTSSHFQEQEFEEAIISIDNDEVIESGNMDYDPENLVDYFLLGENCNERETEEEKESEEESEEERDEDKDEERDENEERDEEKERENEREEKSMEKGKGREKERYGMESDEEKF
jgi:hypothetical protein